MLNERKIFYSRICALAYYANSKRKADDSKIAQQFDYFQNKIDLHISSIAGVLYLYIRYEKKNDEILKHGTTR